MQYLIQKIDWEAKIAQLQPEQPALALPEHPLRC